MCSIDKLLIKGVRSFSPSNQHVIEFYRPLTLIVGQNGAGKTVCFFMAARSIMRSSIHMNAAPFAVWAVQPVDDHLCCCMVNVEAVPSADRHRVFEASLHRRAAAKCTVRPGVHPRPQGAGRQCYHGAIQQPSQCSTCRLTQDATDMLLLLHRWLVSRRSKRRSSCGFGRHRVHPS